MLWINLVENFVKTRMWSLMKQLARLQSISSLNKAEVRV